MKKFSTVIWVCLLLVPFARVASGQESAVLTPASREVGSDREQDGLNGAVRRVRVETAKVVVRDGKPIEGPRTLQEVTTYDIKGKRIDRVAHPVQADVPTGKEQYRYDDKGNIIEMIVRGDNGSILSKERYDYEFDELGNWKKMSTSIVVYEDGKLGLEPVEVAYRTIAYYYDQTVEKLTLPAARSTVDAKPASASSTAANTTALQSDNTKSESKPPEKVASDSVSPDVATVQPTSANKEASTTTVNMIETGGTLPSGTENKAKAPEKAAVKYVSEDVLRAAAIELPAPEIPAAIASSQRQQKVEVQVIVDEQGHVTSARATSPESLLNISAETAARKAKFSATKLSPEPAQIFSVLTYDFSLRVTESTPVGSRSGSDAASRPSTTEESRNIEPPASPKAAPSIPAPEDLYKQGLSQLATGRFADAEDTFKQFVYRNPDDVRGYCKLGIAYSELQKYEEAVAAFKLAIGMRRDAIDAETYFRLGIAYNALKKYSDAVSAFKQALYGVRAAAIDNEGRPSETAPSLVQLHYNLGIAYYNVTRYADAVKELKQAIAANAGSAESYYGLAMSYLGLGDKRSAEIQVEKIKPLNAVLAKKLSDFLATQAFDKPLGCRVFPCNR